MDTWILKQLRALVLLDLDRFIPSGYFLQQTSTFDPSIPNSNHLSKELSWGILAAKIGKSLHFDSPSGITPRQIAASEVLMNLGMLASTQANHSAARSLSEKAKSLNAPDGNTAQVALQLNEAIFTFHDNIRGALQQYLHYLAPFDRQPFESLLEPNSNQSQETSSPTLSNSPIKVLSNEIEAMKRSVTDISKHTFQVALSFPGEDRALVEKIARALEVRRGKDSVFYDNNFQAQLAKPGLDLVLQDIYRKRSKLVVAFLSERYDKKKWCGLEFRAIRELIFDQEHDRIMYFRTDDADVKGVLRTDGYIDTRRFDVEELVNFIEDRLTLIEQTETLEPQVHSHNTFPRSPVGSEFEFTGSWDLDVAVRYAIAQLSTHDWQKIAPEMSTPLNHNFAGEYHLVYRSKEGVVIAFGTITDGHDCHACAPYLSLFEYEKVDTGWRLVTTNIAVCRAGQWGELPPLSAIVVAEDKFGVLLEDGYTAQGWTNCTTSLYVRVGDRFKNVLKLLVSQGDPDGRSWSSLIKVQDTKSGLFNLVIQRSGAGSTEELVFMDSAPEWKADVADHSGRVRSSDVFRFDGQRYVRNTLFAE